jgi:hypothetical protein
MLFCPVVRANVEEDECHSPLAVGPISSEPFEFYDTPSASLAPKIKQGPDRSDHPDLRVATRIQ